MAESTTFIDNRHANGAAGPDRRRLSVAVVCDFLEEGWPSMDLFGDMLARCYQTELTAEIEVEQLRPSLNARFSSIPVGGRSTLLRNADRLLNRFHDYPRWLRKRAGKFELFHIVDHSYGQLALELPAGRTVVTCHDLDTFRCLLDPRTEPRPRWFRAMADRTLAGFRRAAHVICPSESTRSQLLSQGWFSADRVTVIHPGADPTFFSAEDRAAADTVTRIVGNERTTYLLHVGSTTRRKRIDVLLRVFAEVSKEFPHVRLVRVGGPLSPEQAQLAADLGVAAGITEAPRLSKAELAETYRKAAAVLQPSDAEGFGLPVIEALACGCPVIASDLPALREAGGLAAEYCPVGDVEAWRQTVVQVLRRRENFPESATARKTELRRHASKFTWPENAKQTLAVYRGVFDKVHEVPQGI